MKGSPAKIKANMPQSKPIKIRLKKSEKKNNVAKSVYNATR